MQLRRPTRIVAIVVAALAVGVAIEAIRKTPSTSTSIRASTTPAVKATPVRSIPIAADIDRPDGEAKRPDLTTSEGQSVDTDGLTVADFLSKIAPIARRGDAVAAYRVYQAEAMCASLAWKRRIGLSGSGSYVEASWAADLASMAVACADVTPAQLDERFTFLDQAIRAGNPRAMIDYRLEGPNGHGDLDEVDPRDPLVVTWKLNVSAYLRQLAADGNRGAWALLAQDCESGLVVDRNVADAVTYWSAVQVSREPQIDPRSVDFIDTLAKALPTPDAQRAIDAGRALGLRFPDRRARGSVS